MYIYPVSLAAVLLLDFFFLIISEINNIDFLMYKKKLI